MKTNLKNKIIIITGSSSGLGLESAKKFASLGNTVILACRNIEYGKKAERIVGENSLFIPLDVSSRESIDRFARKFGHRFSKLDI